MAWAYFQNQAAFTAYHDAVCADLGIPRPGRNRATGEPAILSQWTDAFVEPVQIRGQGNVTTWAARIPDAHVVQYDAVLGITVSDGEVVFNADGTVTVQGQTYTVDPNTLTYKKAKPPTYTMDGKTYDTATGEVISP